MLYDFIYRLQQKSDRTKRQIIGGFTALAAIVLLFGWVVTIKDKVNLEDKTAPEQIAGGEEKQNLPGPLATLKTGFGFVFTDAKDRLEELFSTPEESYSPRPVFELPIND